MGKCYRVHSGGEVIAVISADSVKMEAVGKDFVMVFTRGEETATIETDGDDVGTPYVHWEREETV